MTPRAIAEGAGLRGPGQDVFPEAAKQQARDIGLVKDAARIWTNERVDDGGADFKDHWKLTAINIDGRVDAVGRHGAGGEVAGQINEETTHIITLEPHVNVDHNNRIEIADRMWILTGEEVFSDEASTRLQAKELVT